MKTFSNNHVAFFKTNPHVIAEQPHLFPQLSTRKRFSVENHREMLSSPRPPSRLRPHHTTTTASLDKSSEIIAANCSLRIVQLVAVQQCNNCSSAETRLFVVVFQCTVICDIVRTALNGHPYSIWWCCHCCTWIGTDLKTVVRF